MKLTDSIYQSPNYCQYQSRWLSTFALKTNLAPLIDFLLIFNIFMPDMQSTLASDLYCYGKYCYFSFGSAQSGAEKRNRLNKNKKRKRYGTIKWLVAYKCNYCNRFHIGPKINRKRTLRKN